MKVLSKNGTKIIFLIISLIILLASILLLTRCHTLRISKNILNVEERELLDGNSNQLEDGIEFNVEKQWNFRNPEEADNYRATFKLKKTVGQVTTDVLDVGDNIKTITITGNESGKFEDLPKYEQDQEITYSVEEIKIEKTTDGGTTWVEVSLKMFDTEYLTNAVFKKYDGQTNLFGISMTKTDIKSFSRNTTLTKDEVLAKPGVTRIDNIDDDGFKSDFEIYGYIENGNFYWWSEAEEVYFHPDTTNAFRDYYNCVTIDLTGTNTSLVTDFSYWFQQDSYTKTQFTTLIGAMDTSSATNMAGMFYDCNKLLAIDTSKFNTSKVTSMYKMFGTLRSIDTLDVSMFDTSNVTNMEWMFRCNNAKELDLSSFDTSKVTNMRQMFYQLSTVPTAINATYRLETIKLGPKFTTSKVTNMEGMFGECKKLKTIYVVDDLDTSKATKYTNMFINCTNLVGEAGTTYETPFDANYLDKTYARIAKEGEPGYFTQYVPEAEEDEIDSEKIDIKYELVKNIEKETAGYTVYYKEQGTNNPIAESKTVNGLLIGERITENAISIEGYKAVMPDSTEIEIVSGGNEYTFYYTKRNDLEYTVHYKEEGTEKTIGEDKLVSNQTFGDTAHETAIDIDGYNKVNPVEADINITAGTNEHTFYYTKRTDLSYTVHYYKEGTTDKVAEDKTVSDQTFGDKVHEKAINVGGYSKVEPVEADIDITTGTNEHTFYYTEMTDLEYTIHYKEQDTEKEVAPDKVVPNQKNGDRVEEEAIDIDGYNKADPTNVEIEIVIGTNEYTFYYTKRTDLEYTVHYKEQGTEKEIAPDKEVSNQTFGDKVHEEAIDIDKYTKVNPSEVDINITTGTNEHTFYYTKRNDLSYTVHYKEQGTENEIAPNKTVRNQIVDDKVVEEAIDIDGYNKVDPTEAEIEITEGTNEYTFYYTKRTDLEYKVRYVDQTTNEEIGESKVVEDVTFKTEVKAEDEIKIIDKYNYVEYDKEKIIVGTNPDENVITLYYTKKNASVIVHHYEEGTTNRVAEDVLIPGKVDDEYHAQVATDIPEYLELANEPQNKDGVMTVEQIEVIYYYKVKDTKVVVNYIDKITNETIAEEVVIDGKVKDSYETEKKDIENYTFVEDTQNTNGEMTVDIINVNYYYKHNAKIIVNYIYKAEDGTEEILKTKEETGLEGDTITTAPENFEGYVIGEQPDSENVTMTVEPITVNYYYKKISKGVVEKHIDENNNSILYEEVHTGIVGEEYEISSKEFARYELDEENLPTNNKGTYGDEVIEVVYKYKYIAKVTANYVDQDGEKIVDPVIKEGNIGDDYKTEQKEFKKYEFVETEGNPEGKMTREDIEVTYHYKIILKKVIENHIDLQENEVITNDEHQVSPGDEYTTEPKDLENYDVIIEKLPSNGSGEMGNEDIVINYYYIRKAKVEVEFVDLYTGKKVTKEVEHNGHVGDEYSVEELEIPGYKLVAEKYPLNASGEMTKDPIKVTYYYVKESTVTEKHMYKNTVLEEETHTGLEGEKYSVKPRTFENYILDEENLPDNREGIFTDEDIEVTFKYVEKAVVIEKHIDENTKEILAYEKHEGKIGDKYKISSRKFSGYEIEYASTDNNMGVMTKEPIEVIFWYKKAEKKTTPAQEQPKGQGNPAPATVVIRDNGTTYVPSSNGGTTNIASYSGSNSLIKKVSTDSASSVTPKVDPYYDVVSNVPDTDSETNKIIYAIATTLVVAGLVIIVTIAVIGKKKNKKEE